MVSKVTKNLTLIREISNDFSRQYFWKSTEEILLDYGIQTELISIFIITPLFIFGVWILIVARRALYELNGEKEKYP